MISQKWMLFFKLAILFFFTWNISCSSSDTKRTTDIFAKDTAAVNKMNLKANSFWSSSPDSMIVISKQALAHADCLEYPGGRIDALRNLGMGNYEKGNYVDAISYYKKSIEIASEANDFERAAKIHSNLAMPYIALGKHTEALRELSKGIEMAEKYQLPSVRAHAVHNIGMVYHYQHKDDSAISYYNQSLDLYESLGDTSKSTFILGNIGHLLLHEKKFDKAKAYYKQSLRLAEKQRNFKAIGNAQQSLGSLLMETKEWEKALSYLLTAKKTLESTGEKTEYLRLLENLSECYLGMGQLELASRYAKECFDLAKRSGQLYYQQTAARCLSSIFEIKKDGLHALQFYKEYKIISDSLYSRENKEQLVRQEEEWKFKKQHNDLEILYSSRVGHRNDLLVIALVLILALMVIAVLLIKNVKQKRKSNQVLKSTNAFIEEQNILLEESDRFKKSLLSLVAHDVRSPINNLHFILRPFKDGLISAEETKTLLASCYDEIESMTDHIEKLLLWVSQNLHSSNLQESDFNVKAIFEQVARLYERSLEEKQITLDIDCDELYTAWADPEIVMVIVRNLVDNAIKFCEQGGHIQLKATVNKRGDRVVFSVSDTGVGFSNRVRNSLFSDAKTISLKGTGNEKGFGIGLQLCLYYLELCGSELAIESSDGKGSIFRFELETSAA
ncbi:MAG: tetratricopeptide repeat protein [Sphingobacterium sp.]|jgi:signal transduction histidine kinase/Tfp pilus assembly protein PilF|nr:tetratricopeptide repeat protein [Sphingobacterium sp.]